MELKFSKMSPLMGGRIPLPQVPRWFCGSFHLAEDYVQRAYTLDKENEGIVYVTTIRFICSDFAIKHVNGKDCSCVSEEQHLDILDALQGF